MAITRPLTATSGGSTSSTASSFTVTDPGAIGTDDVVIVAVSTRRDRTVTTPSGWSVLGPVQAGAVDGTGINLYVFWQRGEPSTWSFSLSASSTGWAWICDVFSGVDTTGDPWVSNASADGTDASVDVPALSSLPSGCTAVAFGAYRDNVAPRPTSWGTDPGGYASITESNFDDSQGVLLAVDDLGSGTSVSAATWTLDVTPNRWAAQVVALEPATTAVDYDITPTGSITGSGAARKTDGKAAAGSTTSAGAASRAAAKITAGSTTSTGLSRRGVAKLLASTSTPAGVVVAVRTVLKAVAGTVAAVGTAVRATSKRSTGIITTAGSATTLRAVLRAFTGALAAAAGVSRSTAKRAASATTAAGVAARSTSKATAGSATPTAVLAAIRTVLTTITGIITATSTVARAGSKRTAGSVSAAAVARRSITKIFLGALAAAGSLATAIAAGSDRHGRATSTLLAAGATGEAIASSATATLVAAGATSTYLVED